MRRSNFNPRVAHSPSRYNKSVGAFGGVDYSTQKFLISGNRAIDILNYEYRDGVVQKRHGTTDILKINETTYVKQNFDGTSSEEIKVNSVNFNNIWSFVGEDKQRHIIAHIGKLLYEIKNIENEDTIYIEPLTNLFTNNAYRYPICYEYENYKSMAFVGGNKLWFLGGNKYMVIRFRSSEGMTVEPVESSELIQIPTTTISITYANAKASGRSSLDNVNLLTKWRYNELASGVGKEDASIVTTNFDYTLDSPLIVENESDMKDFIMTISERGGNE